VATADEIRQEAAKVHAEAAALHQAAADVLVRTEEQTGSARDTASAGLAAAEAAERNFDASAKSEQENAARMLAQAEKLEQEANKLEAKADVTGAVKDRNEAQYDRAIAEGDSVRAGRAEQQARQEADKAAGFRTEVEHDDLTEASSHGAKIALAAEALDAKAHTLDTAAHDESAAESTSGAVSARHHADADAALRTAATTHIDFTGIDADTLLQAGVPRSEIPGDELMNPADDASGPHHAPPISDEIPGYQDYQDQSTDYAG
jgi:hypothetical protein